jgi:hypothetical protein
MNERIKELMMQCWNTYYDQEVNGTRFPIVQKFDAEKFAELIVRECIEVCKSRAGNSDYNTGRMHCVSDLKEHFGVKL